MLNKNTTGHNQSQYVVLDGSLLWENKPSKYFGDIRREFKRCMVSDDKKCITRNNEYYKLIRNSSVNCLIFSVLCIIHWYHACYFTYLIISVQYTHRTRLSTRINSPITIDYHSGNSAIICLLICLCFLTFCYVHALLL